MRDVREFEAFAFARAPQLYRTAWFLCGDSHAAEDLVQETLARVYVAWGRGRGIDNPPAYAHSTLVRVFISARRRRSAWEAPTSDLPEATFEDADVALRATLTSALAELPPADRAVLVLRFLEDRPVVEVAQLLGLSSGAVRNRSMRALDKVRVALGSEFEELTHGGNR